MAAAVEVRVHHGASPGLGVNATNQTLRFKRADDDVQDANDPVPIPSSGVAFSWRKSFRLVATSAPDNRLSNLRFFTNGASLGTDRTVRFARASSYVQASAGDIAGAIGSTDAADLTASAPEVLQAGTFVSSGDSFPTAGGALQDYVMLQLEVGPNALAGDAAAALSCSYRYDEV